MKALFLQILSMSAGASAVILAVLLARLLLRKAPKKYSYLLWAVVGFRLACPVSFKSVFGLFQKPRLSRAAPAAGPVFAQTSPVPLPAPAPAQAEIAGAALTQQPLPEFVPSTKAAVAAAPAAPTDWLALGAAVWIAGMAALVIWALVSEWRLRRSVAAATILEENVWQSEAVRSPFLLGLFRPRIYIPYGLGDDALRYVLAHERCHIRRLDHLSRKLAFVLLILHWFNPLAWLAFWLMGRDMELSCDESVLSSGSASQKEYSRTLLAFAANKRSFAAGPLAFGENGVKTRIKNALGWKKPKLLVTTLAAVLTVSVLAACGLDAKQMEQPAACSARTQNGFYRIERVNNKGAVLRFVDCAANSDQVLCSKEGCAHNGPECPAFVELDEFEDLSAPLVVGNELLVLHWISTQPACIQRWQPQTGLETIFTAEGDLVRTDGVDDWTGYYSWQEKLLLLQPSEEGQVLIALDPQNGETETLWKNRKQNEQLYLAGKDEKGLVLHCIENPNTENRSEHFDRLELSGMKRKKGKPLEEESWKRCEENGLLTLSADGTTLTRTFWDGKKEQTTDLSALHELKGFENGQSLYFEPLFGDWVKAFGPEQSTALLNLDTGEAQLLKTDLDRIVWMDETKVCTLHLDSQNQLRYGLREKKAYLDREPVEEYIPREGFNPFFSA